MNAINQLLNSLKLEANVHHNGQYCGAWAVDTSGTKRMTFHLVSRGNCFVEVDKQLIELSEGDAVFFPGDARHRVTNQPNSGVLVNKTKSISMTKPSVEASTGLVCGDFVHNHPLFDKLAKQLPKVIVVRVNGDAFSRKVIDLMMEESRSSDKHSNVLLNRLADCLFYLLVRNHLELDSGVFAAFSHPNLSKAMDLMHQQSEQRISLDELAEVAGMSRSAFSSLFKDVVGQPPMDYLTEWRMAQAYRWLADDGITTFDAATRCGYETEASFSKAFKRIMGVGPGQARAVAAHS